MDKETRENWAKIEKALRAAGKTDTFFYKRALAILETGVDPMR